MRRLLIIPKEGEPREEGKLAGGTPPKRSRLSVGSSGGVDGEMELWCLHQPMYEHGEWGRTRRDQWTSSAGH
eukprot:scaffold137478_cov32-Tisochrysis_lutea.AAC.1